MKHNSILLLSFMLLMVTSRLASQPVTLKWGSEQEYAKQGMLIEIIGNDENSYYGLKQTYTLTPEYLTRYNMQHEILWESRLSKKDGYGYWQGTYLFKDNLVLFFSILDSKKNKHILYASTVTKDGKQEEPQEIDATSIDGDQDINDFKIFLSEDKSRFLIVHQEKYSNNNPKPFLFKLFTSKLDPVWEKAVPLSDKKKVFTFNNCRIDDEGNVFILGTVEGEHSNDLYRLFAYYSKTDKLEEAEITLTKSYALSSLRMNYLNGQITLVGFYGDPRKAVSEGVLLVKLDAQSLATVFESHEPFTKQDLNKLVIEQQVQKGMGVSKAFRIDTIMVMPDGDRKIIAEAYHERSVPSQMTTVHTYSYQNIMVVNIDKDGKITWVANIPKMQVSNNDAGVHSSYLLACDENNLYMIYNDNPKNTAPQTSPHQRGTYETNAGRPGKLSVTLATVNEKGQVHTETLIKNETELVLKPRLHTRFGHNKIMIHGSKGNRTYKLGFLMIGKM